MLNLLKKTKSKSSKNLLIIGLGNIGEQYHNTRHNAGFLFVEHFLKNYATTELKEQTWEEMLKLKSLIAKAHYAGNDLILAKPTTFMNLSGEALKKIISYYKIPTEKILVVFDDIDLPLGTFRFKQKGSAGTHNGVKSIIQHLGHQNFARLKIGIESRGIHAPAKQALNSFVLENFKKKEMTILQKVFQEMEDFLKTSLDQKTNFQ